MEAVTYIKVQKNFVENLNEEAKKLWDEANETENECVIELPDEEYLVSHSFYDELNNSSLKTKIDPYDIPNVNFSTVTEDDDEWEKFKQQRLERGFDDSELDDLFVTIASFILPRLKAFKENNKSYLSRSKDKEEWNNALDTMIEAFAIVKNDTLISKAESAKLQAGLDYFRKYFLSLYEYNY